MNKITLWVDTHTQATTNLYAPLLVDAIENSIQHPEAHRGNIKLSKWKESSMI